jgi:hypothetical protein
MAYAAWQAQLKISGAPVGTTAEAMALLGGSQYQVTNTAKRVIDPATAITIKDGGVTVSSALYSFDYLFGIVTFSGYSPTGSVTLDGSYIPVASIGQCRTVELSMMADLVDVSIFENQAKQKQATLVDFEGSLERLSLPVDDLDGVTAGTQSIDGWMKAGTPRLLDVLFAAGARFRGWILFAGYEVQAQVDGIVTVNVKFKGSARGVAGSSFNWGA